MKTLIATVCLCSSPMPQKVAAEIPSGPVQRAADEIDDSAAIRSLINQLASRNPAPKIIPQEDDWPTIEVPEGYDLKLQVEIDKIAARLGREGTNAFDELIKHSSDDRYCTSVCFDGGWRNLTVGEMCCEIMRGSLQAYLDAQGGYYKVTDLSQNDYLTQVMMAGKLEDSIETRLKTWWAANSDKQLWELQLDATSWARMNVEKKLTFPDEKTRAERLERYDKLASSIRDGKKSVAWKTRIRGRTFTKDRKAMEAP